jgi:hypothetical protein
MKPDRHSNDDRSLLIDLLSCIVCNQAMTIQRSSPDLEGGDLVQYRCSRCDRIERVRLLRKAGDRAW